MDIKELLKDITINVNVNLNVNEETVELLRQLLGRAGSVSINRTSGTNEHAPEKPAEEPVAESATEPSSDKMDIKAIADTIREYVKLVESGEDIKETSSILTDEIKKMSGGRVIVYLGFFGRFRAPRPNLHNTPEVAALYNGIKKWHGFCKLENLEDILTRAFYGNDNESTVNAAQDVHSEDENNTSAVGGKRAPRRPTTFTYKNSFERVTPGSGEIHIRKRKDSDELAPMIIDSEIARVLYDNMYTDVRLGSAGKTWNGIATSKNNSLNLVFTREDERTRAPRKSSTYSRLRPHGYNKSNGQITTYAINGDEFQNRILKHFNMTCNNGQECVFSITQRSVNRAEGKVAYEITKKIISI